MNRVSRFGGFVIVLLAAAAAAETPNEQPKTEKIPLDQIWAYAVPGTRNVRDLEPKVDLKALADELKDKSPDDRDRWLKVELTRRSDVLKILKVLNRRPEQSAKASPAFIVFGTGQVALQNAQKVFSDGKAERGETAPTSFPPNTDLTLVWYSHLCGHYVRLVAVELSPRVITVKYRFATHQKGMMAACFALIPIGSLSEGIYEVKVEQLEPTDELGRPIRKSPVCPVSDSFSFDVRRD